MDDTYDISHSLARPITIIYAEILTCESFLCIVDIIGIPLPNLPLNVPYIAFLFYSNIFVSIT